MAASASRPARKRFVRTAWQTTLSRGPGYEALLPGLAFDRGRTGKDLWADAATSSVPPLLLPAHGLVTSTSDGSVLGEAPSRPPSQILNGWITALWGLLDVGETLGDVATTRAFDNGVECLRRR